MVKQGVVTPKPADMISLAASVGSVKNPTLKMAADLGTESPEYTTCLQNPIELPWDKT